MPDSELNRYSGITAMVFGAAGFIGRWVSRKLSQSGANLVLVVRPQQGVNGVHPYPAKPILQRWQVQGQMVELDITQSEAVKDLLERTQPAIIFNLAGYGVDPAEQDAHQAYQVNATFVQAVCQFLAERRQNQPIKESTFPNWQGQELVHVGSAQEYGALAEPTKTSLGSSFPRDLREDTHPNPTTLYGKSKLEGTLHVKNFGQIHGIKALTARLFTVYGPGEHPNRLLPQLMRTAREKSILPLTLGTQVRDFTYVEEVAEGLLRLGLAPAEPGEVINLATGKLHSVRYFSEIAARILGIPPACLDFGALPTRDDEMQHDPVNIQRLRSLTGWAPAMDIAEGIRLTVAFQGYNEKG